MIEILNKYFFGPAVPVILFACGLFFLFKLKFFIFTKPVKVCKTLFKKSEKDGVSPFKAVTVALAGTLGVGNIVGVATAITLGGAGAIFWMWISALLSMVIKYAEIVLAMRTRRFKDGIFHGGAMYYISKKPFALLFALLCIICSISMGDIMQVNAAAESFEAVFGINGIYVSAAMAILTFIVIFGGKKRIFSLTVKLVPIMSLAFILLSMRAIMGGFRFIPEVFSEIFKGAFSLKSAASGAGGYMILLALRYGVIRGLISNEAGCGTSPIAHSSADSASPAEQGCWGIFEVFVDTILLCTLCALVILLSGAAECGRDGMSLVIAAFETTFGALSGYILTASITVFAFATLISWSYYGFECIYFITQSQQIRKLYAIIFCVAAVYGGIAAPGTIWCIADLVVGAMTLLNLYFVFARRDEISLETYRYFK